MIIYKQKSLTEIFTYLQERCFCTLQELFSAVKPKGNRYAISRVRYIMGPLYRRVPCKDICGKKTSKMFVISRYSSLLLHNSVTLHYPDHYATKALKNHRG